MKNKSVMLQCIHSFFYSGFIYIIIYCLFFNLPELLQKDGLINYFITFPIWVEYKARSAAALMQESHLALNFIGNLRSMTFIDAKAFQSSGLFHLLAISGGQIIPLATYLSSIIGFCLYAFLKKQICPSQIMLTIHTCKIWLSIIISIYISYIFSYPGTLIRTSSFSYFSKLNSIQKQYLSYFLFFPKISSTTFLRIILLIFITFIFGNIFNNYSFLLSAIGASITEISAIFNNYIFKKNKFIQTIGVTITTSFLVGILLIPFSPANLINSCMANILALPVVGYLITPLALLALFIPNDNFLFPFILKMLDLSFIIFKNIAFIFSDLKSNYNPFNSNNLLFTEEGKLYLNIILIILWALVDTWREKKIFSMRCKLLNM